MELTVTRGLLGDGSRVGPVDAQAEVQFSTSNGTASGGMDYVSQSGTLTFPANETTAVITVAILDDDSPEGDEFFSVSLLPPVSSNSVLYPHSTVTIVIPVNDGAGGLVEFESTEVAVIGEDNREVAQFIVQRTVGTFDDLVVAWSITENLNGQLASADFGPPNGTVTIPNGESQATLSIQALDDLRSRGGGSVHGAAEWGGERVGPAEPGRGRGGPPHRGRQR